MNTDQRIKLAQQKLKNWAEWERKYQNMHLSDLLTAIGEAEVWIDTHQDHPQIAEASDRFDTMKKIFKQRTPDTDEQNIKEALL